MKSTLLLIFTFLFFTSSFFSQTFDGTWSGEYVTPDDQFNSNSIGQRVMSVGAFENNSFVALVRRTSDKDYYLVGYKNANHNEGQLGTIPYTHDSLQTKWISGFDQAFLNNAKDLATSGSYIYVANNDDEHNILMFEIKTDSIYSHPQRLKTNSTNSLWAIDVDNNNNVFVTSGGDSNNVGSVLVYNSTNWKPNGKKGSLLQEIVLPDNGSIRGITVNAAGTIIYVSNWLSKKIYCYTGTPTDGYTIYNSFSFDANVTFDTKEGADPVIEVGPWGLQYMETKNLLLVCHDANFGAGNKYNYGRIYITNPNTGEIIDTVDVAEWNLAQSGQYNNPDSLGTSSGYTSVYNVDYDDQFNLYSNSYYGWAVDKWNYSTELPTIEISITDIEKISNIIPTNFNLEQNYPNPFNPTTTIEFSVNTQSDITLSVYSITGELVTTLIDSKNYISGVYKVSLDANLLSSGTYFYTLTNGNSSISKKMTLIK